MSVGAAVLGCKQWCAGKPAGMCNVCQFTWCKFSHLGQFQAVKVMSLRGRRGSYRLNVISPPDSHVDILTPRAIVLGGGSLWKVIRS